jgi:hypothetical protein
MVIDSTQLLTKSVPAKSLLLRRNLLSLIYIDELLILMMKDVQLLGFCRQNTPRTSNGFIRSNKNAITIEEIPASLADDLCSFDLCPHELSNQISVQSVSLMHLSVQSSGKGHILLDGDYKFKSTYCIFISIPRWHCSCRSLVVPPMRLPCQYS